ncbi:MAG: indolepyruvate oxidoreductase subunit beta, partial [Clostridia bacterium]|nr:indolepyruvate oxidoreductase subunit beta [Clostridia bacterium]
IVGVGGQGSLLASRILGNVLVRAGYDVKLSEVHGMSQRGGSVVTYVKYGPVVYSPIVGPGEADLILGFEQLEAARWISYLKPGGQIVTSTQRIDPMPVITGAARYPEGLLEEIREKANLIALDALSLARQAGTEKAVNVVLIGVLAAQTEIPKEQWIAALKETVPPRFLEMNLSAFDLGYGY